MSVSKPFNFSWNIFQCYQKTSEIIQVIKLGETFWRYFYFYNLHIFPSIIIFMIFVNKRKSKTAEQRVTILFFYISTRQVFFTSQLFRDL